MELDTRQFGRLGYEAYEVIHLDGIESNAATSSSWLLLADKHHPHLYWLQSTTDSTLAVPVCSLAGISNARPLRVPRTQAFPAPDPQQPAQRHRACIALAEIRDEMGEVYLDLEQPILINPQSQRGIRLMADDDQTLQQAPSAKAAPLQKCA